MPIYPADYRAFATVCIDSMDYSVIDRLEKMGMKCVRHAYEPNWGGKFAVLFERAADGAFACVTGYYGTCGLCCEFAYITEYLKRDDQDGAWDELARNYFNDMEWGDAAEKKREQDQLVKEYNMKDE